MYLLIRQSGRVGSHIKILWNYITTRWCTYVPSRIPPKYGSHKAINVHTKAITNPNRSFGSGHYKISTMGLTSCSFVCMCLGTIFLVNLFWWGELPMPYFMDSSSQNGLYTTTAKRCQGTIARGDIYGYEYNYMYRYTCICEFFWVVHADSQMGTCMFVCVYFGDTRSEPIDC